MSWPVAAAALWPGHAAAARADSATPSIARSGAPAPQIALQVVGGGTSNLAAERGKVVLVNFWATWCEPCKSEMPGLQQLADELQGRPFVLYSVDLQEDAPQVEAFQQQYDLNLYAVIDEDGDATRAYGVRALPVHVPDRPAWRRCACSGSGRWPPAAPRRPGAKPGWPTRYARLLATG